MRAICKMEDVDPLTKFGLLRDEVAQIWGVDLNVFSLKLSVASPYAGIVDASDNDTPQDHPMRDGLRVFAKKVVID